MTMSVSSLSTLFMSAICALGFTLHAADSTPDRATFFDVPSFTELSPTIEVVSEKTEDGVKVTEMYFAGAPFGGQPTKIYGFYCRPEKDGKYPGVLEIHGAGLGKLGPEAGIDYAKGEKVDDDDRVLGWFEYRTRVPRTGWYELLVPGGNSIEYFVNDAYVVDIEGDKVGSFWLEQETIHSIRLQKLNESGMPPVVGFMLKAVSPDHMAGQLRVTVADKRTILRKGESLRLLVETASPRAPFQLGVTVMTGRTTILQRTVTTPNYPGVNHTEIDLPCDKEGAFTVTFSLNGKPLEKRDIRPVEFKVSDTGDLRFSQDK